MSGGQAPKAQQAQPASSPKASPDDSSELNGQHWLVCEWVLRADAGLLCARCKYHASHPMMGNGDDF